MGGFRFTDIELPGDAEREALYDSLSTLSIDGSLPDELAGYLRADFERFLYTLALTRDGPGRGLEIGANPYFMTALFRMKRPGYRFDYLNYFAGQSEIVTQTVTWETPQGAMVRENLRSFNINIEAESLPVEEESYDLVLFCEVLEHFTHHPLRALNEIWRLLKPNGTLILTTPNVARYDNIAALIDGRNLYDPFSGYGPHGRHNREYCRHELHQLLNHAGFTCDFDFTSDVHTGIGGFLPTDAICNLIAQIPNREKDLGQYLFSRWRRTHGSRTDLPRWLYRSYPEEAFT